MSDLKKEFYLCPVSGMPFGENITLEELSNENINEFINEYEFKGVKYSEEVQLEIDKGLIALVVCSNDMSDAKEIQEVNGVKSSKIDFMSAERTGDYAFISKELFSSIFGEKSHQEMHFISQSVFEGLVKIRYNKKEIQKENE